MLTYPFCDTTVTVYHKDSTGIHRTVAQGFYRWEDSVRETDGVAHFARKFLLILPGSSQQVFPGDRVIAGEGPEISPAEWESFVPSLVPGLSQAAYATPWYWEGVIAHTEAGRK